MRPQNRRGKRQLGRQEEEPEIDDLVVAASFAQVSTLSPATEQPKEHPTGEVTSTSDSSSSFEENKLEAIENEASNDTDDDSDSDDESGEENKSIGNEAAHQDDGDSDDESDVYFTKALERMHDDEDDPVKSKKGDSQAPTTEHELDPYRTPIEELETKFQLNLTVAAQERLRLETGMPSSGPVELCAAGNIKCHMIMDRTIVVESVASKGSAPLDEGSLLLIRVPDEGDEKANARLLPLGKVFEVFGPVSRPLYTIRLPPATKKEVKKERRKEIKVNDSVERDADEISLNDDEDTERGESREAEKTKVATSTERKQSSATTATSSNRVEEKKLDPKDGDNSPHDNESDPWSPDGNYTTLLQSTQNTTVFYIPDIARLLDTGAIIRNSGRGCDASNLFDEEVANANEMEFSDDEQEREFKNRNKRDKKGVSGSGPPNHLAGRERASVATSYTGFYPPQRAVHPANQPVQMAYYPPPLASQYPQQFAPAGAPHTYQHPNPYPYLHAPHGSPGYFNYAYPGTAPPPQPQYPPQAYPYAQTNPQADEESDTVYYDYS